MPSKPACTERLTSACTWVARCVASAMMPAIAYAGVSSVTAANAGIPALCAVWMTLAGDVVVPGEIVLADFAEYQNAETSLKTPRFVQRDALPAEDA